MAGSILSPSSCQHQHIFSRTSKLSRSKNMKNNDVRTNTYFLYPCPNNNVHTGHVLEQSCIIFLYMSSLTYRNIKPPARALLACKARTPEESDSLQAKRHSRALNRMLNHSYQLLTTEIVRLSALELVRFACKESSCVCHSAILL